MIGKMVTESSLGRVVMSTREIMSMTKETAMERCFGRTALYIKVNGKRVSSTVMER